MIMYKKKIAKKKLEKKLNLNKIILHGNVFKTFSFQEKADLKNVSKMF